MYFRKMVVSSDIGAQGGKCTTPSVLRLMFIELTSQPECHGFLEHIQFAHSFILNSLWLAGRDTKSEIMSLSLEASAFF